MPTSYPKDRFDSLPQKLDRVGAHRASGKKGHRWVAFWWAFAATILLIATGMVGMFILDDRLNFDLAGLPSGSAAPAPTIVSAAPTIASAVPTPEPTVDPGLGVTVLNGTPGIGVAGGVGELLTEAGWAVEATGDAPTEDVPETLVYYSDPALEGAARGIAGSLPGSDIELSDAFADSEAELTVVVGNDYESPED